MSTRFELRFSSTAGQNLFFDKEGVGQYIEKPDIMDYIDRLEANLTAALTRAETAERERDEARDALMHAAVRDHPHSSGCDPCLDVVKQVNIALNTPRANVRAALDAGKGR